MRIATAEKTLHLGFHADERARCGAKSMARTSSPARVTCLRCVRAVAPPLLAEPTLTLELSLTEERRAVVAHLAAISDKTVEAFLLALLARDVDALRLPI